mgnify:CR=1 FL=1
MDELSVLESVEAGQAPASAARSVKDIPLGITRGMASDDYHADRSAVSSSQLKRMLVSPAVTASTDRSIIRGMLITLTE